MPTSFRSDVADRLFEFAVSLGGAARLFTVDQLARHPDLSWYREPNKRAREFLARYPKSFETIGGPSGKPARRRLTKAERMKRGIKWNPVSGQSKRSEHWLGIGDIYLAMTFAGGRPTEWKTEPDGQFDVYCVWQQKPILIEYQRTPITEKQWSKKWELRLKWYRAKQWATAPRVVLVDLTGQQIETIKPPKNTIHVRSVEELPRRIKRPPQA